MYHLPVLLNEVIEALGCVPGKLIVDGTLGGGGHAREIISRIMPEGIFVGVERDAEVFAQTAPRLKEEFSQWGNRLRLINENYRNLRRIIANESLEKIDGLLLDLGFSSWHVDQAGRGFTFRADEPLDMRYDTSEGATAADLVNGMSERELADCIYEFGEERLSRRIAKAIVEQRRQEKFATSGQLAATIEAVVPGWYRRGKIHPATRTFQALRIAVNDELGGVKELLESIAEVMAPGGRVTIISFHSLEDRLVKEKFKELAKEKRARLITKKPITASREEEENNPRSRSAKLRVLEMI